MNATTVSSARSKASLSGELSDFLIELSAALQKYAMYPPGHPVLGPASESVFKRLSVLLASHGGLSIGVAREQLIIEGVATDSSHALLRSLADRLHHHELGAISFAEGVAAVEIAEILALVAEEPERTGRPLGREPEEVLKGRPHVRLHPVRYDSLKLRATAGGAGSGRGVSESGTHLWVGLAQAALASREEGSRSGNDYDPGEVARAIDDRSGDSGYDQVIIGYMVQIADDLKDADPLEENALRERFSELLGHLKPETLQRLLRMGGDARQRKQFLDNASRGVAVDAVLELVKAAAEERQSDISRWMMQLLGKMARHARTEAREIRYRADESLRDQVRVLLSGWQLENPNPTEYEQTLGKISAGTPVTRMGGILARAPESGRIFRMSLETGAEGEALRCAVDELLDAGEISALVKSLAQAPAGPDATNAAVELTWLRLAEPAVVRRILSMDDPDPDAVEAVLERAGVSAAEALLDQLATAESLSLRRRTFDRIVQLGPTILPLAIQRIEQPESVPWYVLRNMLALVNAFESIPAGFTPAPMHEHENSQVRYEALKASLHIPGERETAILRAIHDPDVRIVALGTSASESGAPASAETRLTEIALTSECEPEIRMPAIRALAGIGTITARDSLLRIASPRRRLVGRTSFEGSAATCAALRALGVGWRDDPEVARILEIAASSDVPAVREAVS
ncbi:MAG: hypothetical protein M8863_06940 [marine benthic group bacterium]|nr:hypothetical protein [Gemmatimonadota bacterium]